MVSYRNDEAFEIKGYWSDDEMLFDDPTKNSIAGTLSYLPGQEATLQLFGAFTDERGEDIAPSRIYGIAGQRKIVLKDIQLKRFSHKSFAPFSLREADYVAFDFDIWMPDDVVSESRQYDRVVIDFSNLSVWRRPVENQVDSYGLGDVMLKFFAASGRHIEIMGVHTVTETTRSRISFESSSGKNRNEWIDFAKDIQDFLSLIFMKPVSIEYVSLQGKNAQEMVQPFFWQRVKPNDVKQEKAGGIDFAFARIKSSFEEHAVDFLASNEKTKRLYKSILPILQKTDEDILTNLGRILPAIDSFQDDLKFESNGKPVKDFAKRVERFILEIPDELLSKYKISEKWGNIEAFSTTLKDTRNAISHGWDLPTDLPELNLQLWMIIQLVWLRLFLLWGVQQEVLKSVVLSRINLMG